MVNGTAVWDGVAVTTKRVAQSQTTLLDQGLSPSSRTKGETKERMTAPSPEKEVDMRPDTDIEQLMAVLHEETKNGAGSKMSEVQRAAREKEAEMRDGQQRDKVEALKQDDGEITVRHEVFHIKRNTSDGSIIPTEDINPERAQLECPHMEDRPQGPTCAVQEEMKMPSLEEPVTPAEVTECWDEYVAPTADDMHDGESSSKLIFASLLSNTQAHLKLSGQHDSQTGWHFPAGPGLAEEVQCPLWQFPAVSYYPPIEPTVPFEGEDQNFFTFVIFPLK